MTCASLVGKGLSCVQPGWFMVSVEGSLFARFQPQGIG